MILFAEFGQTANSTHTHTHTHCKAAYGLIHLSERPEQILKS